MKIVRATAADVTAIAPLLDQYRVFYKASSDLPAAEAFLKQLLNREESVVFLALKEEYPVGFAQLFPSFSTVSLQRMYILNDLFVAPDHRNSGVGKALLAFAQRYCIDQGGKGLVLETATDNPANELYAKMGWTKDTHCFHYFWSAPRRQHPEQDQT